MSAPALRPHAPRKLAPLLSPRRYKGAYGGRGGAKSHFFAEMVVMRCYSAPTRAACVREIQKDLKESVRQLVVDKIKKFNLGNYFQILDNEIRGANGSLIIFKGMQTYNAESIKSLEGYDIVWVEEAQSLSATSLRVLRPTIRKEGSELWFSWNPRHDTDPVDAFFRGASRHPDALAVEVNWQDNPWLPQVLREEKDHDYGTDAEMAAHVWGGGYLLVSEGAYFAKLIAQAEREGRIGYFPHDPGRPVITAWDIGVDDYTAVWFVQEDGLTATVIDYYEASGDGPQQIVPAIMPELDNPENLRGRLAGLERPAPFRYEKHQFPHDVKVREWGGGAKSRVQTLLELGFNPIKVGAPSKDADKVAAIRALLPFVRFNNTRRVMLGVARLRRFSRRWNEAMQTYGDALHDINSHGTAAFAEFAFNCSIVPQISVEKSPPPVVGKSLSDMTYDELMGLEASPRRANRV